MKLFKLPTLLALAVLIISPTYLYAASVYKISKNGSKLYIGGTIHLLKATDYPLPVEYQQAYSDADKLVFETDIEAISSPEFQLKLIPHMTQMPGETLKSQLSSKTWNELNDFLKKRNIPQMQVNALSPAGAILTLSAIEFQLKGFDQQGVDYFYYALASKEKKHVGWLESVESQIALLASFNDLDANELITYTLRDLSLIDPTISSMLNAWETGDMSKLADMALVDWKAEFPDVYKDFIVDRNNHWLPQIIQMLEDSKIEYILVGALHLAGEDGLLHLLEKEGYNVEKL